MKRIFCIALSVLILLLAFSIPITAHSGKTDAAGGHYDHSSGEYHYHHGEPAHQHPNGKCPYDSSGEILGLDYGTFFVGLLIFTVLFSLLVFKLGFGDMICPAGKEQGCLPIVLNIVAALILAAIALVIVRFFIS